MEKLIVLVTTTVLGAIGWWAGAFIGTFSAFAVSMIGTGVGIYAARWFIREYLP